jgi:hypothetical protein
MKYLIDGENRVMLRFTICTSHQILQGTRDLDVAMCCARGTHRGRRVMQKAFLVVKIEAGNHLEVLPLTGG